MKAILCRAVALAFSIALCPAVAFGDGIPIENPWNDQCIYRSPSGDTSTNGGLQQIETQLVVPASINLVGISEILETSLGIENPEDPAEYLFAAQTFANDVTILAQDPQTLAPFRCSRLWETLIRLPSLKSWWARSELISSGTLTALNSLGAWSESNTILP